MGLRRNPRQNSQVVMFSLWSDAAGDVGGREGESERPHCSPRNKRIGRGPTIIRRLLERPAYKGTVRDT